MIRKATLNDIDQIWSLRLKTTELLKNRGIDQWQYLDPSKERFINDIHDQSFFVYEIDHKIVGMMYIMRNIEKTYVDIDGAWRYERPYVTIHRLAVDQSLLGKGIADQLLSYSKSYAKSIGIDLIRIDTHEQNKNAIRLFEKHGFVLCGTIMLEKTVQGDRKRLAFDTYLGG